MFLKSMIIRSKKDLELFLSRLKGFSEPSWELEQYPTPSEIAADWIWQAVLKGDINGKTVLDAACGPGILGIAALMMGAKEVYFLDKDPEIMKTCQENVKSVEKEYQIGKSEFIAGNIGIFDHEVEVVLQNPPFGTKEKHVDKLFLEKAFNVGKTVWSMHKATTKVFVEAISKDFNFEITDRFDYEFPIKAVFKWHEKPVKKVDVSLWRMVKSEK